MYVIVMVGTKYNQIAISVIAVFRTKSDMMNLISILCTTLDLTFFDISSNS